MNIKIYLIHNEWKDTIILNLKTKRLYRENALTEYASFKIYKNILEIYWDNWDEEYFIAHNNNNTYFYCNKNKILYENSDEECYIDNINNIVYKINENCVGIIDIINNDIFIKWFNFDNEFYDLIKNNYEYLNNDNVSNDNVSNDNESKTISNDNVSNDNVSKTISNDKFSKSNYIVYNEYRDKKIPNIIHFVFGFKEQIEEFELYRYIAIKSAYEVNKPDKIYFYYYYEPYGYWWDKIKSLLTLEKVYPPDNIFENSVLHYAHKADIVRLNKLNERGGIYLDIDTICLKSFDDLRNNSFVMGYQKTQEYKDNYGLCNAVMLAEPNSKFGLKWIDSYKSFRSKGRDEYWDEHSVILPLSLANDNKDDITILDYNAFFYPLWNDINNIIFSDKNIKENYKEIISNNYCIHLWDTYSHSYLKSLTENIIFSNNTLYNIFSRKFLRNKISIVMLTYNRYDMTVKCLNSYLKCLDRDDIEELIIFDNNSNKDCDQNIIDFLYSFKKKHQKIKIILSDDNLGVCGGRTVLFKEAIGDIIISIDSDAYLLNNSFFDKIKYLLNDEKHGIVGISGAYLKSWDFGTQEDIDENDDNEYYCDHIAGCCQSFRRDLFIFGFELDEYYGKFWVEDTDLSMQSLFLKKKNLKINQKKYIEHNWGGSGKNFQELFLKNWTYFSNKWRNKVLLHLT
jgi:mannosyltransferase OCH1-like enzyme